DLTELSVNMVKAEMMARVQERAEQLAEERVVDLLLPRRTHGPCSSGSLEEVTPDASRETTMDKLRVQLRAGRLDDRMVELETQQQAMPMIEVLSGQGMEEMGIHLKDMLSNLMPTRTKRRRVRIAEARRLLVQEEAQKLVDMDEVVAQAIRRAENAGIIFLDELDKIAGRGVRRHHDGTAERVAQAVHGAAADGAGGSEVRVGCGGGDRGHCDEGEHEHGEHRGAAALHDHGAAAGGDLVQRPGNAGQGADPRRRLRVGTPQRHHPRPGPVEVHFVMAMRGAGEARV